MHTYVQLNICYILSALGITVSIQEKIMGIFFIWFRYCYWGLTDILQNSEFWKENGVLQQRPRFPRSSQKSINQSFKTYTIMTTVTAINQIFMGSKEENDIENSLGLCVGYVEAWRGLIKVGGWFSECVFMNPLCGSLTLDVVALGAGVLGSDYFMMSETLRKQTFLLQCDNTPRRWWPASSLGSFIRISPILKPWP